MHVLYTVKLLLTQWQNVYFVIVESFLVFEWIVNYLTDTIVYSEEQEKLLVGS